ncbi:hypothetical protein BB559_001731 [Furculomyces boomerangus]|uniref:Uncharacterized protein n=1 Tax=Furculomyces boomerangus TaxID=61424 RepID=A0A2T9Z0Y8_9FUNG|nr:hypothetical protein BB559_001731 [Furculomyces boomerangus]
MQIWDTAGQERFRSISKLYYRGADVAIIVYDITNQDSFDEVDGWVKELKEDPMNGETIIAIVGNKLDLAKERRIVPYSELLAYKYRIENKDFSCQANESTFDRGHSCNNDFIIIETSCHDEHAINSLFEKIAKRLVTEHVRRQEELLDKNDENILDETQSKTIRVENNRTCTIGSSCCWV